MDKASKPPSSTRQDRLERELRTNLKRRKEQARARRERTSLMDAAAPANETNEGIGAKPRDPRDDETRQ